MRITLWLSIGLFIILLTACGQAAPASDTAQQAAVDPPTATPVPAATSTLTQPPASPTATEAAAEPTGTPEAAVVGSAPEVELLPEEDPPPGATNQFSTDFSKHIVPYSEILSGGPPKDGIPAIDNPKFVSVSEADEWLEPQEPVALVQVNGEAKAYPLQILMWHEIVNDEVGGVPVSATFCPLCNTVIAFDRRLDGQVLDFGTTGRLRFSNLVMYDRQTETWWQQATGQAIAGELVGRQLTFIPAQIVAWEDFKTKFPDGLVLSRDTGFNRSYGRNPYTGYDNVGQSPFLYRGPATPGELPPMARVITIDLNGEAVGYPYDVLAEMPVVNDVVGGEPVVVFWEAGVASALDTSQVATGRDVGTAATFSRRLNGQELTFRFEDGKFLDDQTNSEWNILGQAVSGELAGSQLTPVTSINHFWFSWAAFRPETRVYQP